MMTLSNQPACKKLLGLSPQGFHTIAYTDWGDTSQSHAVICVHGLSRNGRDFDPLAQALAQQGYRVLCPDMPGRGQSAWFQDSQDYNYPQYLQALTSLIAHAQLTSVDWIGTSMGGILGMFMATQAHTPIRNLILNDVGAFIPGSSLKTIKRYLSLMPTFKKRETAQKFLQQILSTFGPITSDQLTHLVEYSFFLNKKQRFQLAFDPKILETLVPEDVDLWPFWERLTCPVFLIRGAHSKVLPDPVARQMCQREHTHFHCVEDAGHAPALMAPEQIAPVIAWLTEQRLRSEPMVHTPSLE